MLQPGAAAAETAWLLSRQAKPETGYAPYLLAVGAEQGAAIQRQLKVAEGSIPALLFFDRLRREFHG